MEETERILRQHAARYPRMQPTDAVKLIYQSEFGGGHLIRDAQSCLEYLRREYASVVKDPLMPLYEDIGNGIVRVHLAAVQKEDLPWLGSCFITSAGEHGGTMDGFLKKLEVLRKVAREGFFTFDLSSLDIYLESYRKAGYPAVSHSPQYRECYHPAYRIILRRLLDER